MSEPRYPTRVSDPDETTRIPKEALEGLRDADQAREGGRPTNGSSGGGAPSVPPARDAGSATPANGTSRPGANGFPSDGSPAVPPRRRCSAAPGRTGRGLPVRAEWLGTVAARLGRLRLAGLVRGSLVGSGSRAEGPNLGADGSVTGPVPLGSGVRRPGMGRLA